MKNIAILILVVLMTACGEEKSDSIKKETQVEELIVNKDGVHTEYYPGKKKIKIQGNLDSQNRKQGRWVFYSESGLELSTTTFKDGKKNGFSLVKFPNGQVRYYGDYVDDTKAGVWKTYDSKGTLVDSTEYIVK